VIATASEFLVAHGCTAALTRCRDGNSLFPHHGESVVIRTSRGLELGEVLCPADSDFVPPPTSAGEILRRATLDDARQADNVRLRAQPLLSQAHQLIEQMQLPLAPLDADILLDGQNAILHVLCWERCALTPFLEELRSRLSMHITLQDESRPAVEREHGCSECGSTGGCGSCGEDGCGEGGCSSGSCSRGKFDNPEELTRYFAGLREQMLARERVPLL
jgi:hypothetical protein